MSAAKVVPLARRRAALRELERKLKDLKGSGARALPADDLAAMLESQVGRTRPEREKKMPKSSKPKAEAKGVVSFRFDAETLKRLDAAVARMNSREPWRTTGRTDLVRLAVAQFLEADEKIKGR